MILDPKPIKPAANSADIVPQYFTPERNTRQLRVLTALEQMYGYYTRD